MEVTMTVRQNSRGRDIRALSRLQAAVQLVEPLETRQLMSTVAALTPSSHLLIFDSNNAQAIYADRTITG